MSVSQSDSLIGSVLGGRYELIARVNRGGTAVVYRGIDRRLGRTVAVKVIHSDLSGDPDYAKRFDREARAAAILSHPNIVAVFDQGHSGERSYIVMEFIHGQSLRSIISSSAPLPPSLALTYAHEVAKALAAAHDADIIHRDIKPENILITNDGQVKVTDFGLAKNITAQTSTASQGVLMGTMSYIAPEIPQSGSAGKASDIYSTGIVMYEMLTGKKPHVGEDLSQVIYKHVHVDIPPPSQGLEGPARTKVPDYVDALVTSCTSRNPDRRPVDGRHLEELIAKARRALDEGRMSDPKLAQEFLAGSGVLRTAPGAVDQTSHPASAVPEVKENTPVHPIVPVAATKLATARPQSPAKPGAGHPPAQQKTKRKPLVTLIVVLVVLLVAGGLSWWLAVGRWTSVPDVAGLTEQDARTQAVSKSLSLTTLPEYSETVAVGQVIRTDPQQGSRVRKGSTITAYISKGQERYSMPTVVGLSQDDAVAAILNNHLAQGTITQSWSETVPEGQVMFASQNPGASLKPNTPIDLTVSKGRQPIPIDSYVGKTQDEATQGLTGAGFQVTTSEDNSASVPQGSVISQDPPSGNGFHGDTITLVISKGPVMVAVPTVWGMSRADATTALTQAGFVVTVKNVNPVGTPVGFAASTDPKAGAMAPQGSTVTLNIV
ncbi:MAG: Stk1 family PASTA domain-containing Ser/Thr kinase [Propionibacteriaceae bacterium]|nr:Stk1 family PASTA domain-containing Ser/Thr kinase [Propionibacteriaceae bacterium]